MSTKSQCKQDIQRYSTLKSNIESIMSNLSLAADNVYTLNNEIENKYQVNDNFTPIVTRTTKLKNNIESTYNYLKNTIIPAIDSNISELNKEINKIEQAEKVASEKKKQESSTKAEQKESTNQEQTTSKSQTKVTTKPLKPGLKEMKVKD